MRRFLSPEQRSAVLALLERDYGGRGTALEYRNAYELLVAVILSAQSTDKMVNVVTGPLFERFPTPEALATQEPESLQPWIAKIGLCHAKARYLSETARLLVSRHGGLVPKTRQALEALPGVGRKTANVVLSNAFGIPAIPVDTHVFRVANRLGLACADHVQKVETQLQRHIPREKWAAAHHWLIWHGRECCIAQRPRCSGCALKDYCLHAKREESLACPPVG